MMKIECIRPTSVWMTDHQKTGWKEVEKFL